MNSQGGAYVADPGGTAGFRSPDHSRHGWGVSGAGDFTPRGGGSAYGVTPSLSGTSGHGGGENGLTERAPGSSPPPTEPSRPLAQILSLTTFEIGDERWPRSRELLRAGDEARPNEGEDAAPRPAPSLWTGEDAARLVAALNEVQLKARERAGFLTSCLNKLDRWQNQVANRKRKKEMQQTGASGGSLSSGNAGSGAPLGGGDTSRGTAPGPAKKLRTSLVDVGAARPAKANWGSPPGGSDSPRGVTNSANTESEEAGDLEWDGSRSKKKRTRKSDANGDVSWHEEPTRAVGLGSKGEGKTGKVGKVWLGKSGGGLKGLEKAVGSGAIPSKKPEVGKKRTAESPSKYAVHSEGQGWPRGGLEREEKRTPGKDRPLEREGGVAKGMRGPRTGVGGPNAAHLIRLKSFTSDGRNSEMGHTPRGVVKKPPPSGPVGGERKKSPLGGEKKRPASRSPSPSPVWKNPNKVARLARTNSAALKMLKDEYIYTAEKPFSWGKEKKGVKAPATGGDWRKSPKGGVLKVEKEGLVIEAPDGVHISVLKKSHKKGGSAQYRKEMAAIANQFMLDRNAGFDMGAIREDESAAGEPKTKKKNFARGGTVKRGGRSSRLGRQFNAGGGDSFEPPSSRNGDATPSSTDHDGFGRGLDSGLDSWGKRKRTTRQGPDRAAKKVFVGGLQDDSEAESDEEMENELVVAFETLPQTLQERLSSDFWREVEPYFAFLREEDLAFLRENFRELKDGDVVLSVPRCGEHFRKLWANEDQAGRFLLDDNPKTPAPENDEPSAAEAWLKKAGKVSLSHRLLAALIDEEEQIEGKEEEKVALALPQAVHPPSPTSPPINEPQTHEGAADKDPLRSNGPSEGDPTRDVEEPGTSAQEGDPAEKGVEEGQNPGVLGEVASAGLALSDTLTGAGKPRSETGGALSGAADTRGFDDRIERSAAAGVGAAAFVLEEGGSADTPEKVPDQVATALESDDEDLDIVNVVGGGGEETEKGPEGAPERSAWEQKFDGMTLDERIQWELQSIGLVDGKEDEPEAREDDPVCFELRSLQRQLREQLGADNARLGALEQRAATERANEERESEKWALFQFLEKLYERRKGARSGLGPGSSKGGKGAAQKKIAAKEAFLASARRALRKVAEFEAGGSVVPRGLNRKWEEKARAPALEDEEPAATPTDVRRGRNSVGGAPLAVKEDRKARQVAGGYVGQDLPVVASKGQRTRKKPVNKGKRKTAFGDVLGANGTFGEEKELDLERMREREADILAEAQAAAAAEAAAARAEAEQQAAALSMGPSNFEDMTMDLSALPLPDFAGLGDDAFGGGFDGLDFGLGADQFNELAELDKIGLDDLGDMGF